MSFNDYFLIQPKYIFLKEKKILNKKKEKKNNSVKLVKNNNFRKNIKNKSFSKKKKTIIQKK